MIKQTRRGVDGYLSLIFGVEPVDYLVYILNAIADNVARYPKIDSRVFVNGRSVLFALHRIIVDVFGIQSDIVAYRIVFEIELLRARLVLVPADEIEPNLVYIGRELFFYLAALIYLNRRIFFLAVTIAVEGNGNLIRLLFPGRIQSDVALYALVEIIFGSARLVGKPARELVTVARRVPIYGQQSRLIRNGARRSAVVI